MIIDTAREYIGTPFAHQGRVKGVGIDCIGLVICVLNEYGLDKRQYPVLQDERSRKYPRIPVDNYMQDMLDQNLTQVNDFHIGDILLFKIGKDINHVGFFAGDTIIHSYYPKGQVVEQLLDSKWRRRIVKGYRYVN